MPVKYQNFDHTYKLKGKSVFVPTNLSRKIGLDIKEKITSNFLFPDYFYHLKPGGHIAALHVHRQNRFFCKTDISDFFYSCGRNRVVESIRKIGVKRHHHYARWSCVKNPLQDQPAYTLPYGFIQSPILASLVLAHSSVGTALNQLSKHVSVSLFMDDISISSNDPSLVSDSFEYIKSAFDSSPFSINNDKTTGTTESLQVFNCNLSYDFSSVTSERIEKFYSDDERSEASISGFEDYCARVSK
ncbi:reverse transcriptase domain-containing protein [Ponticaulis profundi]|jgi:hypothetical protein|uniref:Reverse transcriptase domain-containing protein n=1 Tax=Ponticaulis profundi TaxID=2665222 RepID=A0ABW1SE62_9PROT